VNAHGKDHGSHCTAQCVNVMEEGANGTDEDSKDQIQRPKRATQMHIRSTRAGISGVHTHLDEVLAADCPQTP
jgi:hypothetical protein